MKTFYPIQIIISEDGIYYNYKGILYTKEEFEEKYLSGEK